MATAVLNNLRRIYEIALQLMIPAILYSKALITGVYAVLLLISSYYFFYKKEESSSEKSPWWFVLIFLGVLISGVNSSDSGEWTRQLVLKAPFLIIPFCIVYRPRLDDIFRRRFLLWTILVFSISSIPVIYHFMQHRAELLELISQGQPIPTPIEHVKYSMFLSFVIVSGVYLLVFDRDWMRRSWMILLAACTLWLMAYMHILAVRTGLVVLYASLGMMGLHYGIRHDWRRVVIAGVAAIGLIYVGYRSSESLQRKVGYMLYDWQQHQKGKGQNYSDSERILSWQIGYELWQSSPIIGTGIGDIRADSAQRYSTLGRAEYKLPHNQLILILASMGVIGLLLFLIGVYAPLVSDLRISGIHLLSYLYLNYSLSFLVENSFERSISIAFFLVMVVVLWRRKAGN